MSIRARSGAATVTGGNTASADNAGGAVSSPEAAEVLRALAKMVAKGPELRAVRLRTWRWDHGALRFCCPGWWSVYLGRG